MVTQLRLVAGLRMMRPLLGQSPRRQWDLSTQPCGGADLSLSMQSRGCSCIGITEEHFQCVRAGLRVSQRQGYVSERRKDGVDFAAVPSSC